MNLIITYIMKLHHESEILHQHAVLHHVVYLVMCLTSGKFLLIL